MNISSKVNRLVGYWTINKLLSTEDKFGYLQPHNICSEEVRIFITLSNNWIFSNKVKDIIEDYISDEYRFT